MVNFHRGLQYGFPGSLSLILRGLPQLMYHSHVMWLTLLSLYVLSVFSFSLAFKSFESQFVGTGDAVVEEDKLKIMYTKSMF